MPDGAQMAMAGATARMQAATDARHRAVEALPPLARLTAPDLTLADYADTLERLARHHARHETAVLGRLAEALPPEALSARRHLPALARDLADLGRAMDDVEPAAGIATVAEAAGWLYVHEGATLGGLVLRRAIVRSLPGAPLRHLGGYGRDTAPMWAETRRLISRCCPGDDDIDAGVAGACAAFDALAAEMS